MSLRVKQVLLVLVFGAAALLAMMALARAERLTPDPGWTAERERIEKAKTEAFRVYIEGEVDRLLDLTFTLPPNYQLRGDGNRAQLRELLPRLAWFLNRLHEVGVLEEVPIEFVPCFRKFGGRLTWMEHYKSVPDVRVVCLPYGLSGAYYSVEPWITDRMAAEILEVTR